MVTKTDLTEVGCEGLKDANYIQVAQNGGNGRIL